MNIQRIKDMISALEKSRNEDYEHMSWRKCSVGLYIKHFPNEDIKLSCLFAEEPFFGQLSGYEAVSAFFDIPMHKVVGLFDHLASDTRLGQIERLKALLV